ncbi:hypothetical protein V8C40DRAFT_147879 [Trichoderma camerunense]
MLAPASNRGSSSGLIRNWQMTASCMMGAKAERQIPWPRYVCIGWQTICSLSTCTPANGGALDEVSGWHVNGSTLMSRGKCWRWHRHAVNDLFYPETVQPAETVTFCCQGKARRGKGEATEWPQNLDASGPEQASLMSCVAAEQILVIRLHVYGHDPSLLSRRCSKAKAKAGTVAQPDGAASCLRCSNRPSEMHQVTSSSYVAAAGWRPLRLPRPLSFDV